MNISFPYESSRGGDYLFAFNIFFWEFHKRRNKQIPFYMYNEGTHGI